ncbi:hypothetical protein HD597_005152 [Nonomuraea thailandensis]|uniref:Uncharacterized protein n=1 Tax=Nonomuraea thailandensis TaxID=1188745 RepID=A0A9X2K290_9ACTN|nr:hypothetical protein [Nonomuraea thailandensis]MCP2358132.1 hypothetical protein [Nonomuraea thailandensis]
MAFSRRRKIQAALPEGYFDLPEEERLAWAKGLAEELRQERDSREEDE